MKEKETRNPLLDEMVVIRQPDGSEVRIPRSQHHEVIEFKSKDKIARLLLVGSVILNFGGGVAYFLERQDHKQDLIKMSQIVDPDVLKELTYRVDRAEIQGCFDENKLREALGSGGLTMQKCIEEWDGMIDLITNFERIGTEWLPIEK